MFLNRKLFKLVYTTHPVGNYTAMIMDEFKLYITIAKSPNQMLKEEQNLAI